jgi:hypothetical protein
MAARFGNAICWFSLGIAIPTGFFAALLFYAWFRHDFDDGLALLCPRSRVKVKKSVGCRWAPCDGDVSCARLGTERRDDG